MPFYTFTSEQKKNCQLHVSSLICNLILGKTSFHLRVSGNFIVQSTNKCHSVELPSIPKFLFDFRGTYLINQHSSHYIVFMALIDHCYIFVLIFLNIPYLRISC